MRGCRAPARVAAAVRLRHAPVAPGRRRPRLVWHGTCVRRSMCSTRARNGSRWCARTSPRGASATRRCWRRSAPSRARRSFRRSWRSSPIGTRPLPIEHGQTISQPYIVALMTAALGLATGRPRARDRHRIGLRRGDSRPDRARGLHDRAASGAGELAARRLAELGFANVTVRHGDGSLGLARARALRRDRRGRRRPGRSPSAARPARSRRAARDAGGRGPRAPEARARDAAAQREPRQRGPGRRPLRSADRRAGLGGSGGMAGTHRAAPRSPGEPRGADPRRGVAVRRDRGERPRPTPRAHRGFAARADRRGEPRHLRVLPDARGDHEGADSLDRASGSSRSRRTGRTPPRWTAGSRSGLPSRTTPAACGPSSAFRPGCGATTRRSTSSTGCAPTTPRRAATEPPVAFYGLDLYSLFTSIQAVLDYLDRVDPAAARVARAALRVPHAVGGRSRRLWSRGAQRALPRLRARSRRDAARPDGSPARLRRARRRGGSSTPCRTPA